jgi:drug/metabolite transporter (DMT)-like permease
MEGRQINERAAFAFALGAVLFWSTVATGFKLGLAVLAVEQLLLLGTAISWLLFLCFSAVNRSWRVAPQDYPLVALLGLINPCAYYLVLFEAYDRLPAHIAQPLNYTWAITLALLAIPVLKQRISPRGWIGIAVSYLGVVLLLQASNPPGSSGWDVPGVLLALASTLLWAIYWLLNTRSRTAPAALMFWSFTGALPVIGLICAVGPGLPAVTATALGFGAWVGLLEMGVSFLLWQQALKRTAQAGRIGQLIFLSPFLSLIMIHFVLHEPISSGAIAGLIVIVAGIAIAQPRV